MKTTSELRSNGTVAIAGAGPAGLTLARLLQMRGFTVKIFERDESPTSRPQGGSLDLRPSLGQKAIDAAGLNDVFKAFSRSEAREFKFIDSQGKIIPGAAGETHEDAGPEIDRGDLRSLLLDSVAPGTISWSHSVSGVHPNGDGKWRLEFDTQEPFIADLVIGADGMGSKVRSRLTSARPRYTGHTMIATNIRKDLWRNSELSDILGEGSAMFAGPNQTIFVQRCNHDLILLYYSLIVPETWPVSDGFGLEDTDSVMKLIRSQYQSWSPTVLDMLMQIDGKFHRWPLSVMPPDYTWNTQSGLTMIGDASHGMPPFTGKGVNLAMFDALKLADALTAHPDRDLSEAIHAFEIDMQNRTRKETGECLWVGQNFYGITMNFDSLEAA
jgi:2-polyprenyl-6-methoxyphenol hydroxylase-like FAD-dependent oxidoreductase